MTTMGYCVRCKAEREMVSPQETVTKNNRKAVRGVCKVCGTKMFKFVG